MASDMNLSLKKLRFENRDGEFFLYSRYELGKRFCINLFSVKNTEAYRGDVSEIDLRSMAATRRMTYTDFLEDTVIALTSDDAGEVQFFYSLEEDAGDHYFRWKKFIDSEGIKANLGRVKVCQVDFCSVIETVLCQVSLELHTLRKSLKKVKLELEERNKEKERSKDLVQNAIKMKEDMEKELYSKFVIILNKKKEKIRKLKERGKASTPESTSDEEAVNAKAKKRTKSMPRTKLKRVHPHVPSASDDEGSDCTDEDLPSKAGPSTSGQPSRDSSLLLDDDFNIQCPVQQPRQRRPKNSRKAGVVPNPQNECEENEEESFFSSERPEHSVDDSVENLLDML